MVGPRYKFVQCEKGLGPVKVYAGGCTIEIADILSGLVSGLYCECSVGQCKAKEENEWPILEKKPTD